MENKKAVNPKRGEIYFVDFSSIGAEGNEQFGNRPAVILQNNIGNHFSDITIVGLISRSTRKDFVTHVTLDETKYPFLKSNSTIMLEHIRTISQNRLTNKLGILEEKEMLEVVSKLKASFDIA